MELWKNSLDVLKLKSGNLNPYFEARDERLGREDRYQGDVTSFTLRELMEATGAHMTSPQLADQLTSQMDVEEGSSEEMCLAHIKACDEFYRHGFGFIEKDRQWNYLRVHFPGISHAKIRKEMIPSRFYSATDRDQEMDEFSPALKYIPRSVKIQTGENFGTIPYFWEQFMVRFFKEGSQHKLTELDMLHVYFRTKFPCKDHHPPLVHVNVEEPVDVNA